jgi:multidrug resistance efflux pump
VALAFELPGVVQEVLVSEGDSVQAGDVLARLDTNDLQIAVENARVALDLQVIAYNALTSPAREEDIAVAEAAVTAAQAAVNSAYASAPSDEQIEIAACGRNRPQSTTASQLQRVWRKSAPSGIDVPHP